MANATNKATDGADAAATAAKPAADAAHGHAQQAAGQAADLIDQARDQVGRLAEHVQQNAGHWADDAADAARRAGRRVQDLYAHPDQLTDLGRDLTALIARHPIPAVLVGVGVGLLLGRRSRA